MSKRYIFFIMCLGCTPLLNSMESSLTPQQKKEAKTLLAQLNNTNDEIYLTDIEIDGAEDHKTDPNYYAQWLQENPTGTQEEFIAALEQDKQRFIRKHEEYKQLKASIENELKNRFHLAMKKKEKRVTKTVGELYEKQ